MIFILSIASTVILFIILFIVFRRTTDFSFSRALSGFKYVYVEFDGSVRELYNDEIEYLKEEFHPGDGNRPYIKSYYKQLTPDKKISGFINRTNVPRQIKIKTVDKTNKT